MEFYLDKENCYAISGDAVVVDTDDVVCKHEKDITVGVEFFWKVVEAHAISKVVDVDFVDPRLLLVEGTDDEIEVQTQFLYPLTLILLLQIRCLFLEY